MSSFRWGPEHREAPQGRLWVGLVMWIAVLAWNGSQSMYAQELPDSVRELERQERVELHRDSKGAVFRAYFHGTDDDLQELCAVATLRELDCFLNFNITDRGIEEIGRLRNLRVLHLAGTHITGNGLSFLPKLVHLRELYCNPKRNTDKAVEAMVKLRKLVTLSLGGGGFTDEDVQKLRALESLEDLNLELNLALTDECMRHVAQLRSLRRLACSDNAVGDQACKYISECAALRDLNLGGSSVTDRGVTHLLKLRRLERLGLSETKITLESIKSLTNLPELRHLSIGENGFRDEMVGLLLKFKKLDSLMWYGNPLSPEAIAELDKSREWKLLFPDPEDDNDAKE